MPPGPPSPRRRRSWGLAAALAVAVGATSGVAALAIRSDGGSEGDPSDPASVARQYLETEVSLDCDRLVDFFSERLVEESGGRAEMLDDCNDGLPEEGAGEVDEDALADILASVETVSVADGRAIVTYSVGAELIGELDPVTAEITLVDEGGAWKVDDFGLATGELPEGSPQAAAWDFAQAVLDGDCEAYVAVLSEDALDELGPAADGCEGLVGVSVDDPRLGPIIRDAEEDGRAVVGINVISEDYEAGNNNFYVAVVEEDGAWKVDQLTWSDFPEEVPG
ncbi:MAG TPA: hypothetical protein VIL36_16060 [Acidimicrobiales bacterium]